MNTNMIRRALVAVALLTLALPGVAAADGTLSGTDIRNAATVDYKVGGVSQPPAVSDTASFVVDNKIDLLVSVLDGAPVPVVPGDTLQVMTYRVTNEGNTVQDYSLSALDSATPAFSEPTEDFDALNVRVFVDANGNGTYDPGTDVAAYIDELAPDSSVVVFVVVDIPAGQDDGDVASYDLIATTAVGGSSGSQGSNITTDDSSVPDNPATVQIVFADDDGTADVDNDGKHSGKDAVKVGSAVLTVSKTADVSEDPINGAVNPKAIPGATVDYSISVGNSGTNAATDVVVVDPIPANTSFVVLSTTPTPSAGVVIEYSNTNGTTWVYSPTAGTDGSDPAVTHLRVTFPSLAGGNSATVDFQVLIL